MQPRATRPMTSGEELYEALLSVLDDLNATKKMALGAYLNGRVRWVDLPPWARQVFIEVDAGLDR